jgi:hypothetical protein
MLDHYLIVNKEDHFKIGDVFVVFRLRGQDRQWLYNGTEWREYADPTIVGAFIQNPYLQTEELQPIIPTSISRYPINVSEYIGIGELWIGYGLRSEVETFQVSYSEMVESGRLKLVWEVGKSVIPEDALDVSTLCISMTGMTEVIPNPKITEVAPILTGSTMTLSTITPPVITITTQQENPDK